MFIILKRDWRALDGSQTKESTGKEVVIPAGRHEIERIPNPYGYDNAPWLVLKGTKHGMTEGSWREWVGEHLVTNEAHPDFGKKTTYGEFEVVIEED